jgi:hypothetical protein
MSVEKQKRKSYEILQASVQKIYIGCLAIYFFTVKVIENDSALVQKKLYYKLK